MAHQQQREFCEKMRDKFPQYFKNKNVLDIGSLDVNGTNNYLFTNCKYEGLDLMEGPNVNIISTAKDYNCPDNFYDIIISTEVFEHDMYYHESFKNIMRILKPGGCFIFTCASHERAEHGTLRTTPGCAPFLQTQINEWTNYYKNLNELDIREIEGFNETFPYTYFEYGNYNDDNKIQDMYFIGIKKDKNIIEKTCVIIGSYTHSLEDNALLNLTTFSIKKQGFKTCLVSHNPLSYDIQKDVNYSIYSDDNYNEIKSISHVFHITDNYYIEHLVETNHSFSIFQNLKNSISLLKEKDFTHFLYFESDEFLLQEDFDELLISLLKTSFLNKDYYFLNEAFQLGGVLPVTSIYGGRLEYFYNILKDIKNIEDYKVNCLDEYQSTLEHFFKKNIIDDSKSDGIIIANNPRNWFKSKWSGISSSINGLAIPGYDFTRNLLFLKLKDTENKILIFITGPPEYNKNISISLYKNNENIFIIPDQNSDEYYINELSVEINDILKIDVKYNENVIQTITKTAKEILNNENNYGQRI